MRPDRLYEDRNGLWEEPIPAACPNGHQLRPSRVLIGRVTCPQAVGGTGGHRTHICRECDAVVYTPPDLDRRAPGQPMRPIEHQAGPYLLPANRSRRNRRGRLPGTRTNVGHHNHQIRFAHQSTGTRRASSTTWF